MNSIHLVPSISDNLGDRSHIQYSQDILNGRFHRVLCQAAAKLLMAVPLMPMYSSTDFRVALCAAHTL